MNFKDRIKQKLKKNRLYDMPLLIEKVKSIALQHRNLVICPESTGSNWLGIKNATLSMFPTNSFVIPQSYSNQVLSDKDLKSLVTTFKNEKGKSIILSGFPDYFLKIITFCNELGIVVEVIFHGGLAELNQNKSRQNQMSDLFKSGKEGKISKYYVVKEGLEVLFEKITGITTERITPKLDLPKDLNINKIEDGKIHIGIFGNNSYNKNRHNQVAAAAMVENSIIHIIGDNEFSYLLPNDRIICHKQLDKTQFLELLGSMHINLYCSYSESWGQVIMESFSIGVPCLFTDNSGISNFMGNKYVIKQPDDIVEIHNKINHVFKSEKNLDFTKQIKKFHQFCVTLSDDSLRL